MQIDKESIRANIRRLQLDSLEKKEYSYAACINAVNTDAFKRANTILAFISIGNEPDTSVFIDRALEADKRVAYPVCAHNNVMTAYMPLNASCAWSYGKYRIPIPDIKESLLIPAEDIDLILVPGMAFDERGGRLGHGAGYYDRYFAQTKAYRLGICLEGQMLASLPMESHDVYMNAIATQSRIMLLPSE